MKNKNKLSEIIKQKLDFPVGFSNGEVHIEMCGRKSIKVQGCKKITEYEENVIGVKLNCGGLAIRGEKLYCTTYFYGAIEINGNINSIEFTDGENTAYENT